MNASLLYIESPSGVGFSVKNVEEQTSDTSTALETASAIEYFFTQKFPELRENKFYLTGESYAGIYVPTLANLLLDMK